MAFNNYLEDENDKPYFTTNSLAYYYDKMEGFAKAVEGSAKALNLTKEEVEKRITLYIEQNKNELDQRLADWDGKLETFDSSVETLLSEWVNDGTLTHVIDSTLIDQKIAPVIAQFADKASFVVAKNFPGTTGGEKIQNALNSPVTNHRVVVVDAKGTDSGGNWLLKAPLKIPSNTTLILNGSILKLGPQVNNAIIQNANFDTGNTNVHIEGHGTVLDCNRNEQNLALNSYKSIGLHFYNVDNFSIKGIVLKDAPRWSLVPEKCTNGVIDDVYFDNEGHVNQDGIHIIGPSSDIIATKIRGTLGDDACVVNARSRDGGTGVFQGYGTGGDIRNVIFDDVIISGGTRGTGAHTGILRTSGSPTTVIDGITLNNAIGYNLRDGMLRLGGNDTIPIENHRNIQVNNIVGYEGVSGPVSLINMMRPIKNVQISNAKVFSSGRALIFNNNHAIDGLQLTNIYNYIKGDVPIEEYFRFGYASIKNLQISNVQFERENPAILDGALIKFYGATVENATFTDIQARNAKYYVGFLLKAEDGNLKNVRLNNVDINKAIAGAWGVQRAYEHDIVINGIAKEDGLIDTPSRLNYQEGDTVAYRNTTKTTETSHFRKNFAGVWEKVDGSASGGGSQGSKLLIDIGIIEPQAYKFITVPVPGWKKDSVYSLEPRFLLPYGVMVSYYNNASNGVILTLFNARQSQVNILEKDWVAAFTTPLFT